MEEEQQQQNEKEEASDHRRYKYCRLEGGEQQKVEGGTIGNIIGRAQHKVTGVSTKSELWNEGGGGEKGHGTILFCPSSCSSTFIPGTTNDCGCDATSLSRGRGRGQPLLPLLLLPRLRFLV